MDNHKKKPNVKKRRHTSSSWKNKNQSIKESVKSKITQNNSTASSNTQTSVTSNSVTDTQNTIKPDEKSATTNTQSTTTEKTTTPKDNTNKPKKPGSLGKVVKANIWQAAPGVINASLDKLNSTSPIHNDMLPYGTLWDNVKDQGGFSGNALEVVDAIFSPSNSNFWKEVGNINGDLSYSVWSTIADLFSDDKAFTHNIGSTARDFIKNSHNVTAKVLDWGGYAIPFYNLGKLGRDIAKTGLNNTYDSARDYETIRDYSYGNLGFSDYIGDSLIKGAESGLTSLFNRFGENRDRYQRGRYALNEMLSTMAKDIENFKDKNSPEYASLLEKFEKFNNLAKSSDFYWATKKEMDASDLSEEDFLKSKNLTPEYFAYYKQNAHTVHNLGNNLVLNESNGNKRSDYVAGNYSYPDYTNVLNKFKKGLVGTDVKPEDTNSTTDTTEDKDKDKVTVTDANITANTGATNTANENIQSNITPNYLTNFYKEFDKKYGYDPAKGRFNIWL